MGARKHIDKDLVDIVLIGIALATLVFFGMFGVLWVAILLAVLFVGGTFLIEIVFEELGISKRDDDDE